MDYSFLPLRQQTSYNLYLRIAWQLVDESIFAFPQSLRVHPRQLSDPRFSTVHSGHDHLRNRKFHDAAGVFLFFGLAQTLQGTRYNSLLGDLTPRNIRGKVIGCSQFFMYLSQALTQLLVGALYAYVSPTMTFVLLAVGA